MRAESNWGTVTSDRDRVRRTVALGRFASFRAAALAAFASRPTLDAWSGGYWPEVVDLALIVCGFPSLGTCSNQIASCFSRRRPTIHCSGTEKFPTAFEIPRSEPTAEKNSHASRLLNLLTRSSPKSEPDWHSISEYAAVWQVCLTLRLMTAAKSPVRDRRDRAE